MGGFRIMATKEKAVAPQTVDPVEMVNELAAKAKVALEEYMKLDQEQVDEIAHAMALAGLDNHTKLAKLAVEETGRGVYEDKIIKNLFATEYIWHDIKSQKTVGIIEDDDPGRHHADRRARGHCRRCNPCYKPDFHHYV